MKKFFGLAQNEFLSESFARVDMMMFIFEQFGKGEFITSCWKVSTAMGISVKANRVESSLSTICAYRSISSYRQGDSTGHWRVGGGCRAGKSDSLYLRCTTHHVSPWWYISRSEPFHSLDTAWRGARKPTALVGRKKVWAIATWSRN